MKRMAEVKDSLDIDVKQNFIDPLQAVADKDIKDIQVDPVNSSEGSAFTNFDTKQIRCPRVICFIYGIKSFTQQS